jgi:hypothetical protein
MKNRMKIMSKMILIKLRKTPLLILLNFIKEAKQRIIHNIVKTKFIIQVAIWHKEVIEVLMIGKIITKSKISNSKLEN